MSNYSYQLLKTYKCIQGNQCTNEWCFHIHPYESEYENTPYLVLYKKCNYETEETTCRKKCASREGEYCPYSHCTHEGMIQWCAKIDCQAHCQLCQ